MRTGGVGYVSTYRFDFLVGDTMGKLRKPQKVTGQTYDAILHDNDLHFNLFCLFL